MRALVTRLRPDKTREKVLVSDWPAPEGPTGQQVKTQTIYSGITNGTEHNDLVGGNYAHPDDALPAGWGYQHVGRVIETGPDVEELAIGDLLYINADHMEYVVAREDGLLIKLPENVDPKHAALFGMSGVAMRSCRHADLRMGERVLVVGQGFIGQMAAQIANVMGARVSVCEIDPRRLQLARRIGAAEGVFDVVGDGWEKHVADGAFDAVIDAAGVEGMEDQLIRALKSRGRLLLIAGRFDVKYTFNLGQAHEITIRQNTGYDRDDLANLCRLVRRGMVDIAPLLRDVVPVTDAKRIYDKLRDDPHELSGTVFVWGH
jgi:2-desacetyl-2-hydroxyethyl bacteriochlorophyllide A dehydrogenase